MKLITAIIYHYLDNLEILQVIGRKDRNWISRSNIVSSRIANSNVLIPSMITNMVLLQILIIIKILMLISLLVGRASLLALAFLGPRVCACLYYLLAACYCPPLVINSSLFVVLINDYSCIKKTSLFQRKGARAYELNEFSARSITDSNHLLLDSNIVRPFNVSFLRV